MTLQGKTVVVTGASSGIGAATAVEVAKAGAKVLVNYARNTDGAEATAATCRDAGADVQVVQGDVSDDAACRAIAAAAMDNWGRIDVLVNNAGTTKVNPHANLDGLSAEDFQRIYAVNVVGAYQMARAVAKPMKDGGNGAIVNVSSIAGLVGSGSSIAYAASKGAMNTMTLSLARALAPEIRVNTVCPGLVVTDFWEGQVTPDQFEQIGDGYKKRAVLGKVSTAEDIAASIMFFIVGDQNVTGQIIASDGGMQLG